MPKTKAKAKADSHYRLGDYLLGIEGLAILRTVMSRDFDTLEKRREEVAGILSDYDSPSLSQQRDLLPAGLDKGYTTWSETYDPPDLPDHDNPIQSLEGPTMRKLMDELPDGSVLDVGSGTGRHTNHLAQAGREVVGVEPNDAMRALAQKKLPDVEFKKGDVSALPVEDASFKNVVCGLVISHLPEIGPPLKEIARVTQPGGHILISTPHTFISTVLHWRAPVFDAEGNGWEIAEIPHSPSEYLEAFADARMVARRCYEPRLTPEQAVWRPDSDGEENPFADALIRAIAGQPGVMVWQAERT